MPARSSRRLVLIVAFLVILLLVLWASLPWLVREYLNDRMANMGDYSGHVSEVDLDLWRGAYRLVELRVTKTSAEIPAPLFQVDAIDLAVSMSALLQGAFVADVTFHRPEINFVDDVQFGGQTGSGTDWREALRQLAPIEIDRLTVDNGAIHFRNFSSQPAVDIMLTNIEGTIENLSNVNQGADARQSEMHITGIMLGNAETSLEGQLDPLGDLHDFNFRLKITGIELQRLNSLSEAYGNFDFESGDGDFLLDVEAENGELEGYAKPLLDDVSILDLEEDMERGPLSAAWEAVVGALGQLFRNQPEDRIASRIEIRGNLKQQDISGWQAFISILRNAFVDAYEATFEAET